VGGLVARSACHYGSHDARAFTGAVRHVFCLGTPHLGAATISRRPGDPAGAILGDLLVRVPSASGAGRRRRVPFAIEDGHRADGLMHFDLLNHPAVYDQIRTWLRRAA
jgi:hypothetical protein